MARQKFKSPSDGLPDVGPAAQQVSASPGKASLNINDDKTAAHPAQHPCSWQAAASRTAPPLLGDKGQVAGCQPPAPHGPRVRDCPFPSISATRSVTGPSEPPDTALIVIYHAGAGNQSLPKAPLSLEEDLKPSKSLAGHQNKEVYDFSVTGWSLAR